MATDAVPVIVAGTVALDLVAPTARAATAAAAVGNSGANIAVRLARAGLPVAFVCLIGDDAPGALVLRDLARWGVRTDLVTVRPGYRTPLVYQVTAGGGSGSDAITADCPACGRPRGHALELPSVDEIATAAAEAARAAAVIVDIAGPAAEALLAPCPGLTWYEASLREASVADMTATAALAQVVKTSAEEAGHYRPIVEEIRGVTRVQLLTAGREGVDRRIDGGAWIATPVTPIEAVDTIGAGDAFTAGAVEALLRRGGGVGEDAVVAAIERGHALAGTAVRSLGARGDMVPPGGGSPRVSETAPFHCTACTPWE